MQLAVEVLVNDTSDDQQRLDSLEALSYLVEPIDNANGEHCHCLSEPLKWHQAHLGHHASGGTTCCAIATSQDPMSAGQTQPRRLPKQMLFRQLAKPDLCRGCN